MDAEGLSQGLRLRSSKKKMVPRAALDVEQASNSRDLDMHDRESSRCVSHSEGHLSDSVKHQGHLGALKSVSGLTNPVFRNGDSYDSVPVQVEVNGGANETETSFIDDCSDDNVEDDDITEESHQLLSGGDSHGLDRDDTEPIVYDEKEMPASPKRRRGRSGSRTQSWSRKASRSKSQLSSRKPRNYRRSRSKGVNRFLLSLPLLNGLYDSLRKNGNINVNDLIQSIKDEESSISIISQVSLPFVIAGFGTVGAGMVLDIVQHWDVFQKVSEIFILVPALLGLKGNLEMTLASRLSTQANLGNMDSRKEMMKMVGGNLSLIQAQAIAVGFLSSLTAMVMGWIKNGEFNVNHALLLCASSLFTASIASLILGSIMVLVILLSRYCRINPDNVATPIAASLGDLVTLTLLSWVGNLLWLAIGNQHWLAPVIIVFFLILLPLWVYICVKNKYTNDVIYTGWTPVLSAMVISSISGLILDFAVAFYHGIAVFQPVINGVGGNLVAVHASRISTTLHLKGSPGGRIRDSKLKGFLNPIKVYFGSGVHSRAARVLTFLTIPGHLIFIYTISYMNAGHTSLSILFNVVYLFASLLQVVILIYIATWMVPLIWVGGSDPDNVAIPYLTAIGDLLGTAFLAIAFHFLFLMGDRDADVGD